MARLREKGAPVRAFVRDRAKAEAKLGADVELAEGDLEQPDTLDAALAGVERVFVLTRNDVRQEELEANAIDAARRAGVRHVVKLSTIGSRQDSPVPLWQRHARLERRLKESGLPYTILQPDWFMQNLLRSADSIREEGKLYGSIGDGRVGAIDTRDIAQGAGDVVTDTVQKVTGRPPRSFDAFARDYAGAFR